MSYEFEMGDNISDAIIFEIGQVLERENKRTAVINPTVIQKMQFVYDKLRALRGSKNEKVSYACNQPYTSMGSVSIEGKNINFYDTNAFAELAQHAANTEAYPLANGGIRVTFGFHNVTIAMEG